jgi:catechol 2,3-dioxygenase-like lactoylglutathione lyase family enzyme
MQTQIVKMINDFEHGRLSRRQLIAHLTGLLAASLGATVAFADQQAGRAAPNPVESAPTFDATDLNHIALSVTDVQRSQKWYEKHLGLKPKGQEGFLTTGKGWLALFQGEKPGLHHTATPSRITMPPMRSRDLKSPASRRDAKAGVYILPIRTASNVRSPVLTPENSVFELKLRRCHAALRSR